MRLATLSHSAKRRDLGAIGLMTDFKALLAPPTIG